MGENRSKTAPGARITTRNTRSARGRCLVSEANIESSPDPERPKMVSGDPFIDLRFFKKTQQDFGLKYFVVQTASFCPILTIFDQF